MLGATTCQVPDLQELRGVLQLILPKLLTAPEADEEPWSLHLQGHAMPLRRHLFPTRQSLES